MTRSEFLQQLKEALENDLSGSIVQDNVDYYNQYITDEVRSGKSEEEVLQMLGDPWMIARTIIDSAEAGGASQTVYESDGREYKEEKTKQAKVHVFGVNKWWQKLLLILGVIGIVMMIVAVISGIITIVAPILIPVCVVLIVIRLFSGQKR